MHYKFIASKMRTSNFNSHSGQYSRREDPSFCQCLNFGSITVDSSNLHFASSDGVLFTKNFETFLSFPRRHRVSSYAIPSSVGLEILVCFPSKSVYPRIQYHQALLRFMILRSLNVMVCNQSQYH